MFEREGPPHPAPPRLLAEERSGTSPAPPRFRDSIGLMSTDDILSAALQLPRGERVELLEALMNSLYPANEEDSGEVSPAWEEELRARVKAFEEGRLASSPAQEAIARLREQLAG